MQCLISTNRDIYFNLALEEYLLLHGGQEYFMLWQSEQAVVVGKHQNTLAEINYRFVRENHVRVARRLSGGGTVFHDRGNLNFTFISNGEPGKLVDFKRFIIPVIGFLNSLGVDAGQGPKNEILARGRKISGNAEHVYKNRVLHHGTLLFHSDLNLLRECLQVVPGRYTDKAVQSNRSSVINISECLREDMNIMEFSQAFLHYMLDNSGGNIIELKIDEVTGVSDLAQSKYATWEWIFGWSPDYVLERNLALNEYDILIRLEVKRGIIRDCVLQSGQIPAEELGRLMGMLKDCPHDAGRILSVLKLWNYPEINEEKVMQEMAWSFF